MSIEEAIRCEDWTTARRLIRRALSKSPDSHWLITRLGLTYYEQRNYDRALVYSQQAFRIAPRCPLVLWDLAGTQQMLGRHTEATRVFRRLIRRGVDRIAHDDCGEGIAWARGLVADCWYRVARIEITRGYAVRGVDALRAHLTLRGPGCRSIYPLAKVRRELRDLEATP